MRDIFRGILSGGATLSARIDKTARTMNPHSTSMETHRAHHRRAPDYHHARRRQQDRPDALARALTGDGLAHAAPGRAPPRPDRGLGPSGRPRAPAPALS